MKTLNLDANYFLDHSTRAIKGKPRMANPEGNSSKEEDDDESIIWNSRWNKNYSGIWQSRGDKPDPQTMLRPKCISLSFRHQYAEPVLAGLHKESNLAGQSFPGSKEAPNAVPRCLLCSTKELHNIFREATINPAKLLEDVLLLLMFLVSYGCVVLQHLSKNQFQLF